MNAMFHYLHPLR